MQTITSRQHPIVRAFHELADTPDGTGIRLLLDGVHLVRDAHRAGLMFEAAAIAASRLAPPTDESALARELEDDGVEVLTCTDQAFAAMSPVKTPSGMVAIVRRTPSTASSICERHDGFLLAAIDVQDPGNLGALIRAAEAGGATGLLACGTSAHPFSWKTLRGSMGSALRLPLAAMGSPEALMACLAQHGVSTIAAVPRGGRAPEDISWTGRTALLLGGEGPGLSTDLVASCDQRVTIPMAEPVDSLNVATAGAILVYAARRQRA